MKKVLLSLLIVLMFMPCVFAQTSVTDKMDPNLSWHLWPYVKKYIEWGEYSFYNKTFADVLTLENGEVIRNTSDGLVYIEFNDDSTYLAEFVIQSSIDSPNVADNDHLDLLFKANDDSSELTNIVKIIATFTDVTDETEDSKLSITTLEAGSAVTPLTLTGNDAEFADEVSVFGDLVGETLKLGRAVLDSLGRTVMYVQNKNGSSITAGDALVWDNTAIEVVASAACNVDHTIADDLTGESGFLTVTIVWTGTPDAGDSIYVYGTTYENGAADTACVLLAATNGGTVMAKKKTGQAFLHFSAVDSVQCNADAVADGATAIVVNAYAVIGVAACDGANTDIAGIAISTITDNNFGYICTHGVCKATVDAGTNAASLGVLLEGAANGDLVTDTAATTGKNLARALEYSNEDNKQILVFVDTF